MPSDGEKFEELLSGFLDGELSAEEHKQVQIELGRSEAARLKLKQMTEVRDTLKASFSAGLKSKSPLGDSLAARVIAEAQREAVQLGLPENHHVRLSEPNEIANISRQKRVNWRRISKFASWTAAVAAAILLVLFLPNMFSPPAEQENLANNPEDEQSDKPRYVSEIDFRTHVLFVVDIEQSAIAKDNNTLELMLQQNGLLGKGPILGGDDVRNAVNQTLMVVEENDEEAHSEADLYFVRADTSVVGKVIDAIYFDNQNYPKVSFNLAIDNPFSKLMETIAKNSGNRFPIDETFVAPVSVEDNAAIVESPFQRVRKPSVLVSASARSSGFSGDPMSGALIESKGMSSVLLIVR